MSITETKQKDMYLPYIEDLLSELGEELTRLKEVYGFDRLAEMIKKAKGDEFKKGESLDVLEYVAHISRPMIEDNRMSLSGAMLYMNNDTLFELMDLAYSGDHLYMMVKNASPGSVNSEELFEVCQAVGADCRKLRETVEGELRERVDYIAADYRELKEKQSNNNE